MAPLLLKFLLAASTVAANWLETHVKACPGYKATNIIKGESFLLADLTLAGKPCNLYGTDIESLQLLVEYQTDTRLHVKIYDKAEQVYQIQESILPSPQSRNATPASSALRFDFTESPFSFSFVVSRSDTKEVLFDTSAYPLIFEDQYIRLSTSLPANPNLYGLGEHSDSFRFPIKREGYRRTLWNADSAYIPRGKNLYGSHPVYFDHRVGAGTHGVFLRNAGGMDIDIRETSSGRGELTYNVIGGVFDFYFLAGPGPGDVARQYSEVVGRPAMMPYWSLGFHQSKYGYKDVRYVEGVARLYWHAKIPVETLWADIDYMEGRKDFTLNEKRWPLEEMRGMVERLHEKGQRFVMNLDPGIARRDGYGPFERGVEKGVFLKAKDGSLYRGESWAGEVVWPDWIKNETGDWWADEIGRFFDPETGIDVDGLWNDMNEVSNFCQNIHCDPTGKRTHAKQLLHTQRQTNTTTLQPRQTKGDKTGLPNRQLFRPPYRISNHLGDLSTATIYTNITNADGTSQYDTHNLHGHLMAATTRLALLSRKPTIRPFILTRSTFAGTGSHAAHWFGDNFSAYDDYRISILQMLSSVSLHQMSMVGSDVCGFNGHADEMMCARWAVMGAWQPFYRNHADAGSNNQEFYQWDSVANAARKAIETRYRLLDYLYTALEKQSADGTPAMSPLWFVYPDDAVAAGVQYQWFFGPAIMVAPVVDYWMNEVDVYLPDDDVFYDFWTGHEIEDKGRVVRVAGVGLGWRSAIAVYIRGGCIVPMRVEGANTTTELRKKNFEVVVAPGRDGRAEGRLYLDDGESLDVEGKKSDIGFFWDGERLVVNGTFGFKTDVVLERVKFLGTTGMKDLSARGAWPLTGPFVVDMFTVKSQLDE